MKLKCAGQFAHLDNDKNMLLASNSTRHVTSVHTVDKFIFVEVNVHKGLSLIENRKSSLVCTIVYT